MALDRAGARARLCAAEITLDQLQTLFQRARATPRALGIGQWVLSNPLRALFVLVRLPDQGRHANTASGRRARCNKSVQAARAMREPWLLVASTQFIVLTPKQLVRRYRQRMQIEESFRDLKSQHFGKGLERSRSHGTGRFTVLVLIATLAAFLLWLLGSAAEHHGLDRRWHPSNGKRRVYSRLFLARLMLTLDGCREIIEELMRAVGSPDQWVASGHDALLAD